MKTIYKIFLFSVLLIATNSWCQNISSAPFEKGSWWLESKVGFTFFSKEIARINKEVYPEPGNGDFIKFQITPTVNYLLTNRLLSGAYIGYGIESFRSKDPKGSGNVANYKTGGQLKYYYLKIIPDIYLHAEAGADYDYMTVTEKFEQATRTTNSYFKRT